MTRVEVVGATVRWPDGGAALRGASLEAPARGITVILGPSGVGKTTLLRVVAGLETLAEGDVLFDGSSVRHLPAERRSAVLVPQAHRLFPHLNVLDNVGFGLEMQRVARDERTRRAEEMLERVGLLALRHRRPQQLSAGQRQRVALARALAVRPRVLLLDEPLANLDAHLRASMRILIRDVQRETGPTTLLVTHDRTDALTLGDRIAVLIGGEVRQTGTPRRVYRRPRDLGVARLLGPVGRVPAIVEGAAIRTPLGTLRAARRPSGTGDAWWLLRPEDVTVVVTDRANVPPPTLGEPAIVTAGKRRRPPGGPSVLEAVVHVRATEDHGGRVRLILDLLHSEGELVAEVSPAQADGLAPGTLGLAAMRADAGSVVLRDER